MGKIAREVAEQEVEIWLEYTNNSSARKKETFKEHIEGLIDAVSEGLLVLNPETKVFTYQLRSPIGNGEAVKSLNFKPRLKVSAVQNHLRGVKATDADGRILAYVCALTSQNSEIIKDMETHDYSVCRDITVFFL